MYFIFCKNRLNGLILCKFKLSYIWVKKDLRQEGQRERVSSTPLPLHWRPVMGGASLVRRTVTLSSIGKSDNSSRDVLLQGTHDASLLRKLKIEN